MNNLNELDLEKHFDGRKISNFFLDSTISNLIKFKKQYQHHIFYAIMWFILSIYAIFLLKNNKKPIDDKKN
jgi:hypothetical protein